jgi:hypothetical protein
VDFKQYGVNTDLEGLAKVFDTNQDQVFDVRDADFSKFGVWQDRNQDGVVDAGEFKTLQEWGIKAIDLVSDGLAREVGHFVKEAGRTVVHLDGGDTLVASDAAFVHLSTGPVIPDLNLVQNQVHTVL